MGRPDAGASPMWDLFSATPDFTPFTARERQIPESRIDSITTPGARKSMEMDFRGPDRNADLGVVLDAYRLWQLGRLTREEAQDRIDRGVRSLPAGVTPDDERVEEAADERVEEAEEETNAFDVAWQQYTHWQAEKGMPMPELRGGPVPPDVIDGIMAGRLPVSTLGRWRALRSGSVIER